MIKAVILDVDGVIVGDKKGFNFPNPHTEVINALKKYHAQGIAIVLCSAKYHFSIEPIIRQAQLHNPHISDNGAIIFNPLDNIIIKKHNMDKILVSNIVGACVEQKLYVEVYTFENWIIEKNHFTEIYEKRATILQKPPLVVDNLQEAVSDKDVFKLITFANNVKDKARIEAILSPFNKRISLVWSIHPVLLPRQVAIITMPGISKKNAAKEVAENLNISFENILGIGDTPGDWEFMSLCHYVGVMGNASDELKTLAKTKGEGNFFIGSSVNDHGVIDILSYFQIHPKGAASIKKVDK